MCLFLGSIMKEINQIYLTPPSIEPQEPTLAAFSPVSETSASTFESKSVAQPIPLHNDSATGKFSLYHSCYPNQSEDLNGTSFDIKQHSEVTRSSESSSLKDIL